MRELDVSSLNKKSPYAVEMRSERDYVFHTDQRIMLRKKSSMSSM